MQLSRPVRMSVLAPLLLAGTFRGQATPHRVSIGGGLLIADWSNYDSLPSRGVNGFVQWSSALVSG